MAEMVRLQSFEELASFLDEVETLDDQGEKIRELCRHYLASDLLVSSSADPFSADYRSHVLRMYEKLSGRQGHDPARDETRPDLNIAAAIRRPPAYCLDGANLGRFLQAFGATIEVLDVRRGARVLEFGPGDGQIALHLARMGCDITVIDIEPGYLEIIAAQARKAECTITTVQGTFLDGAEHGLFDRILFFEAFHHAIDHHAVLDHCRRLLKPDGAIVFSGEPIIDPAGPWRNSVPYPWGLRLDCMALRDIRDRGWMELGFQKPYFQELCRRAGFSLEHKPYQNAPIAKPYIAKLA